MSEAQKPVEEQAAPLEATPAVEPGTETKVEEPVAPAAVESTTAAEAAKDEEPVAGTEAPVAAETKAAVPKKEFSGEGVLGYKAPGGNFIKKIAGFQKKHFWFGSEPVEFKNLTSYLRGEKPDIANHNAAWSSQTGKGLLYFSKHPSEKATPAGIINLADISDVTEDGTVDFFFTSNGLKHVFQAGSLTERESWVAAVKKVSAEAKEMVESIKNSDGYKEQHSNLSKPVTAAPVVVAAATKEPEAKKEEKTEAKEEKKEEKARKSRSASRKRNSIFGNFGLGSKKDEPTEPKEEKKVEAKETTPAETATTEPTVAPLDGPAVAAAVVEAPVIEEPAKTDAAAVAPVEAAKPSPPATKRNSSIFGSITSKFGGQKKSVSEAKPSEAGPAVPVKDADAVEPVSAEAPVIPAPEASEPLAAAVASPATVPVTELTNGVTEAEEAKPEVKAETKAEPVQKRKSSLPFGLGLSKEKKDDVEGEKPKSSSPFAKLRQTIKGNKSPKAAEKAPEKAPEKTEESAAEPATEPTTEPATETPASTTEAAQTTDETIISEPISAAPAAATQVSATA